MQRAGKYGVTGCSSGENMESLDATASSAYQVWQVNMESLNATDPENE
jgi:hypothetical protein